MDGLSVPGPLAPAFPAARYTRSETRRPE